MTESERHQALTRARVLDGAVELADEVGIEALTIRRLAAALGTKPMTIYHHVPSKDAIVDGMVEAVFAQIARPPEDEEWKSAIRQRCISAREVLTRHPWAAPLMESRTSPGPENLGHHEAVLACLRRGGLSWEWTAHAYAVLDAFVYGFAFQESTLPAGGGDGFAEVAQDIAAAFDPEAFPTLVDFTVNHVFKPGYDFGDSFAFGLDLILDALEGAAIQERGSDGA
jgi:AcrR family transcriptional regulator